MGRCMIHVRGLDLGEVGARVRTDRVEERVGPVHFEPAVLGLGLGLKVSGE